MLAVKTGMTETEKDLIERQFQVKGVQCVLLFCVAFDFGFSKRYCLMPSIFSV